MLFFNDFQIAMARRMYADHPVLSLAVETVDNLREWADDNSDGWAYWPKPCRAAEKVIRMIVRDGTSAYHGGPRLDATEAEYRRALAPVKAFRTRMMAQGMPSFDIRVAL